MCVCVRACDNLHSTPFCDQSEMEEQRQTHRQREREVKDTASAGALSISMASSYTHTHTHTHTHIHTHTPVHTGAPSISMASTGIAAQDFERIRQMTTKK